MPGNSREAERNDREDRRQESRHLKEEHETDVGC
jgi:hypothetical protein